MKKSKKKKNKASEILGCAVPFFEVLSVYVWGMEGEADILGYHF